MKNLSAIFFTIIFVFYLCPCANSETHGQPGTALPHFKISSPAFANGTYIPAVYTCSGTDYSPAIQWEAPPAGTRSFALIVDDPDAPVGTFTHWIIFNIPADQTSLVEKASPHGTIPAGALEGKNNFSRIGYSGPCPPPRKAHRYFFKLYALDSMLNLTAGISKAKLLEAMDGHVLGQAQMIGLFAR